MEMEMQWQVEIMSLDKVHFLPRMQFILLARLHLWWLDLN